MPNALACFSLLVTRKSIPLHHWLQSDQKKCEIIKESSGYNEFYGFNRLARQVSLSWEKSTPRTARVQTYCSYLGILERCCFVETVHMSSY